MMLRKALHAALQHLRTMFLLDQPPAAAAACDEAVVRARVQAARRRFKPARRLLERGEVVAGLVLYRDAARLLSGSVHELLAYEARPLSPELERRASLLSGADAVVADELSAPAALAAAEDLQLALHWALEVLNRPTEQQRNLQRCIRFAAVGAIVLLLFVASTAWLQRLPNLALGRPVSASSVAFGGTPDKAVDGVRYGALGFHSDGPSSAWWSVDLGRAYTLERVVAYGRADCCFDQSVPLAFEVSLDGKKYRRISERTELFTQSDPWLIPGQANIARFIRFRTLRKTHLVLSEIEVYGRAAPAHSSQPGK
jgi:F5/8 type C domain-containing protein